MSEFNVDPMKKSSIYAIFGRYYGEKLYRLLFDCCDGFCKSVNACLGISPQGDSSKFLNQQGQWVKNENTNALLQKKVEITSTQLLSLATNPVDLIEAPGPGFAVVPITYYYKVTYGTTDYDFANYLGFCYQSNPSEDAIAILSDMNINVSATTSGGMEGLLQSTTTELIIENEKLQLKTSTNPTQGNSSLTLWIFYSLIEI